jgi:hypothetical protein
MGIVGRDPGSGHARRYRLVVAHAVSVMVHLLPSLVMIAIVLSLVLK